MPAPYVLELHPVVGIDSEVVATPSETLTLTLLPVLKGDTGGGSLPDGGTIDQVLTKLSSANGDANWQTIDYTSAITTSNAYTDAVATNKADLVGGLIPSSQLPSYVDDVLEYNNSGLFPATGESGKIYLDFTSNLAYRWAGSAYAEISPSLALGETSATAYRGDRGKIAFDHSQSTGNPHGTTAAQITGLATVAETGDYNDLINKPVGGATNSFDQSRWSFNELIYTGMTGGFSPLAISSGSVTLTGTIANTYGVAVISSSASANTGASICTNSFLDIRSGMLSRTVFSIPAVNATRNIRAGYLSGTTASAETLGAWVNIVDQTAVAWSRNPSVATTQGSSVLPLNTLLVCDVEFISTSSVRLIVFNKLTNVKYLDETITSNLPITGQGMITGVKAWNTAASAGVILHVDYVGTGIARPNELTVPA